VNNKSKETRLEFKELDLGERRVSRMNFSYIVTLPKIFVQNTANGKILTIVRITMLEDGCLKLTPIREKDESADFVIM
jgi:hypothetical protein